MGGDRGKLSWLRPKPPTRGRLALRKQQYADRYEEGIPILRRVCAECENQRSNNSDFGIILSLNWSNNPKYGTKEHGRNRVAASRNHSSSNQSPLHATGQLMLRYLIELVETADAQADHIQCFSSYFLRGYMFGGARSVLMWVSCAAAGGDDGQQRLRLHPPAGPRRTGGAARHQPVPVVVVPLRRVGRL